MLDTSGGVRIYVATEPQDMRKSFSGLAGAVGKVLGKDPQSGTLFVFLNRRRNLLKILSWDTNGFCLLCKRLSAGAFSVPDAATGKNHVEVTATALSKLVKARHVVTEAERVTFVDGRVVFSKTPSQAMTL
jgi:transposase